MGLILLFWVIFQSIILIVIQQLSSTIPFNVYYSVTIIIFSPMALIIAFIAYRIANRKKDIFTQALFGSTTIFHIILMLYLPSAVRDFPQVINMKTKTIIVKSVPEKEKKIFLKKLNVLTKYTSNLMFANVELVGVNKWQDLTDFWQLYIKDISDNSLTKKEVEELSKKIDVTFKELKGENKKN